MRALVTGGCGFIGSHVVRWLVAAGWDVTNLDKLTYAADPGRLADIGDSPRYRFVHGDICDGGTIRALVAEAQLVINFAAETHVDRSLLDPGVFVRTDVEGVVTVLEALRGNPDARFIHMSTDEVFGSLDAPSEAREDAPFAPSSPYSASKAAAELMVRAYSATYGMPVTVLRSCNVYGPGQHVEKFIPLFTTRALRGERLPLYGDGRQEREWLFVGDFVRALETVLRRPPEGPGVSAVHVGSGERVPNIDVAGRICALAGQPESLVTPVTDRPGHDRRYALDSSRLRSWGWEPTTGLAEGLAETVAWYAANATGRGDAAFAQYFDAQYGARLGGPAGPADATGRAPNRAS